MSDEFLDNQVVTAADMNNIAIDLGSADFNAFNEQTPTAVSLLNNITADLVTPGILLKWNNCLVTVENSKIYVDTGVIVFNNGSKKRIESKQYLGEFTAEKNIYAINDIANNVISLVSSESLPEEGSDYILLGTVSADGVVTDKRTFSQANAVFTNTAKIIKIPSLYVPNKESGKVATIDISGHYINYIFCYAPAEFDGMKYVNVRLKDEYTVLRNQIYIKKEGNTIYIRSQEYGWTIENIVLYY